MLIEYLNPDFTFTDDRGSLTHLAREGYRQINVVSSNAGVFQGVIMPAPKNAGVAGNHIDLAIALPGKLCQTAAVSGKGKIRVQIFNQHR